MVFNLSGCPAGAKGAKKIKIYLVILLNHLHLILLTEFEIFHKQCFCSLTPHEIQVIQKKRPCQQQRITFLTANRFARARPRNPLFPGKIFPRKGVKFNVIAFSYFLKHIPHSFNIVVACLQCFFLRRYQLAGFGIHLSIRCQCCIVGILSLIFSIFAG